MYHTFHVKFPVHLLRKSQFSEQILIKIKKKNQILPKPVHGALLHTGTKTLFALQGINLLHYLTYLLQWNYLHSPKHYNRTSSLTYFEQRLLPSDVL